MSEKKKEIGQMLSHPSVTTEGLQMKHHFKLQQHQKRPITVILPLSSSK